MQAPVAASRPVRPKFWWLSVNADSFLVLTGQPTSFSIRGAFEDDIMRIVTSSKVGVTLSCHSLISRNA